MQPLPKRRNARLSHRVLFGVSHKDADARHALALLCPRRQRPRRRAAAEQRDELATSHSITSSASESTSGGIVRPSALAVLMLMASSNLLDCTTGKSAGFAPFKILAA